MQRVARPCEGERSKDRMRFVWTRKLDSYRIVLNRFVRCGCAVTGWKPSVVASGRVSEA